MKLESRNQKVVPVSHFIVRLSKFTLVALVVIIFSVTGGTIGYRIIGHLKWIDSFHMACMILTGMGPVADMPSTNAKIFSSLYALYSGIAFLTITAVFFTPIIHRVLHILHVEDDRED